MATRKNVKPRKSMKRRPLKIVIPEGAAIDFKNTDLLKKFLTDRGKMLSRRLTGVNAQEQRDLTRALKQARYLGLLPVGSAKRK